RSNPAQVTNVEERIRSRAYELFEKRGGEHGRALDDWLQAEAELLRSKLGPTPVATKPLRTEPAPRVGVKRKGT
ncbi:MAG TPA: DUF2934 domain-containing protein, partial [Terriglobales bacterium]|nr:DUF2934 domain-containing protein [Terriglobales bacterium]